MGHSCINRFKYIKIVNRQVHCQPFLFQGSLEMHPPWIAGKVVGHSVSYVMCPHILVKFYGAKLTQVFDSTNQIAGWLEPMLSRISENKTRVVWPLIDQINDDNFGYFAPRLRKIGIFDWRLVFDWKSISNAELKGRGLTRADAYR